MLAPVALGSPSVCGTHRSAVAATRMMKRIQMAATTASLFFFKRPKASPQRVREVPSSAFARAATVVSATA